MTECTQKVFAFAPHFSRRVQRRAGLAGKSTLNRLERGEGRARYHKISYTSEACDGLLVARFLEAHATAPAEITLDLDATDIPSTAISRDAFPRLPR